MPYAAHAVSFGAFGVGWWWVDWVSQSDVSSQLHFVDEVSVRRSARDLQIIPMMKTLGLLAVAALVSAGAAGAPPQALSRERGHVREAKERPRLAVAVLPPATVAHLSVQAGVLESIIEGLAAFCVGGAYGYAGARACFAFLDILGCMFRGRPPSPKQRLPGSSTSVNDGMSGVWLLDAEASESLEPFLVAVGAPRLIARLVGKKGKPVTIRVVGSGEKAASVTIAIEGGGEGEKFKTDGTSSTVTTPRGAVTATMEGDVRRAFTVRKRGPAEGELITETRELAACGRRLKCTFEHSKGEGPPVTVVRWYSRA